MNTPDFAELDLFITGPTFVREDVRRAAMLPEFGHRDAENAKRFGPIRQNLRKLAGIEDDDEYEVLIYNGSGSTAMESSIRSLVADDETVLNVSVGAFGDLYHKMAGLNGKNGVQLKFDAGAAIDIEALDRAMQEHNPHVVTFTHNETSTGARNDIAAVCDMVRKYGALPLVDGVSIFGGADIGVRDARPAMYATSTQKALGLPAGFGLAFVHAEAFDKAERVANRGHASDILSQRGRAQKDQTLTTPNCSLANQLYVQLDHIVRQEGIEARFKRHEAMRDMVHDRVAKMDGFELFAPEGHRSPTLTCVRCPEGVTVKDLKRTKEVLRGKGYLMDPGYGKLNTALEAAGKRVVFRVGHMGDITPDMLFAYLDKLEPEVKALVK